MGDRSKPWKAKRRSALTVRRGHTTVADAYRAVRGLDIPHGGGGEQERDLKRQCTRKRVFYDEATAVKKAAHLTEHYATPLRAYPCPHCGRWHVGGYAER